jgi:hypothetical protein
MKDIKQKNSQMFKPHDPASLSELRLLAGSRPRNKLLNKLAVRPIDASEQRRK